MSQVLDLTQEKGLARKKRHSHFPRLAHADGGNTKVRISRRFPQAEALYLLPNKATIPTEPTTRDFVPYLFAPIAFRRLFPNLGVFPPALPLPPFAPPGPPGPPGPPVFMRLALKPLRSPALTASPDLACRFLPPKPNRSSLRCRFAPGAPPDAGPSRPDEALRPRLAWLLSSLSTATSKRSASVAGRSPEDSCRSVRGRLLAVRNALEFPGARRRDFRDVRGQHVGRLTSL